MTQTLKTKEYGEILLNYPLFRTLVLACVVAYHCENKFSLIEQYDIIRKVIVLCKSYSTPNGSIEESV